jgi:CHASE2 domain-containing sensor protein
MASVLAGQYAERASPFLIDYSIRVSEIPKLSFADVLHGDEATLTWLRGKKVIVGGTAIELGDRFSVPNGSILPGPVLQALAAESLLQKRALQWTSGTNTLVGLAALGLAMLLSWRLSAGKRLGLLAATAIGIEYGAFLLQAAFPKEARDEIERLIPSRTRPRTTWSRSLKTRRTTATSSPPWARSIA